jgi:hypothetical protein
LNIALKKFDRVRGRGSNSRQLGSKLQTAMPKGAWLCNTKRKFLLNSGSLM